MQRKCCIKRIRLIPHDHPRPLIDNIEQRKHDRKKEEESNDKMRLVSG